MKRKIIALCLIVAMLGVAVIGGTMAYFTDTAEAVNVMTIGSVKIEQNEQEWNDAGKLVPYTQAKPLLPFVPADLTAQSPFSWDASSLNYGDGIPEGAYRRFAMKNVVDKYVTVTNTGKSDAFVRTIFAFEVGEYTKVEDLWYKVIATSYNAEVGNEFKYDGTWNWSERSDNMIVEIDGNKYLVVTATHENAVEPGETTIPSLLQIYMSKDAKQEDAAKLDGNKNGTYDILVLSQAVQASGFGSAEAALNEAFDEVTAAKAVEWLSKLAIPTVVESADELADVLANGGYASLQDDVEKDADEKTGYGNHTAFVQRGGVFDGNNQTLTANDLDNNGDQGSWGIETHGGTIKNVTITGAFRGIVTYIPTEDVILDNVTITTACYALNTAEHATLENINLIVKNSTIGGWTSFDGGFETATLTNCDFVVGSYSNNWPYDSLVKPYITTTFTDCTFAANYYLDLSALKDGCTVTLDNCTVNGTVITGANCKTLFGEVELPDGRTLADCVIFN